MPSRVGIRSTRLTSFFTRRLVNLMLAEGLMIRGTCSVVL